MRTRKRVAISLELNWFLKHHQDVFAGAMDYARRCGDWDCLIGPFPERHLRGRKGTRYCDAILARATRPMLAAARAVGIPLVNVWYTSPIADKVPTFAVDNREAGRMAAQHLMARGFRRFAYIGLTQRDLGTKDSFTGYAETLREKRLALASVRVPTAYAEEISAWERFHKAMEAWKASQSLPVGIFCDRDLLARYVANHLALHGISVPHDAAIIGVGNEEVVCTHPEPSLTSIDRGYEALGFRAAELLDRMIEGEKVSPQLIRLPPRGLIPRGSTDSLVVDDPLVAAALRFIADRSHHAIRVNDVASAVHVSRRSLERQFRTVLNQSVARQISLQRVERAKRMLVDRRRLGKQVARECGFPSMQQMWLTFKRVTGMSPKAFCQLGKKSGAAIEHSA